MRRGRASGYRRRRIDQLGNGLRLGHGKAAVAFRGHRPHTWRQFAGFHDVHQDVGILVGARNRLRIAVALQGDETAVLRHDDQLLSPVRLSYLEFDIACSIATIDDVQIRLHLGEYRAEHLEQLIGGFGFIGDLAHRALNEAVVRASCFLVAEKYGEHLCAETLQLSNRLLDGLILGSGSCLCRDTIGEEDHVAGSCRPFGGLQDLHRTAQTEVDPGVATRALVVIRRLNRFDKRLAAVAIADRLQASDDVLTFRVEAHNGNAVLIIGQLSQQASSAVAQIMRVAGRILGSKTVVTARRTGPWPASRHAPRVVQHDNNVDPGCRGRRFLCKSTKRGHQQQNEPANQYG